MTNASSEGKEMDKVAVVESESEEFEIRDQETRV
jgi:hypothetical protein